MFSYTAAHKTPFVEESRQGYTAKFYYSPKHVQLPSAAPPKPLPAFSDNSGVSSLDGGMLTAGSDFVVAGSSVQGLSMVIISIRGPENHRKTGFVPQ